ncbi:MAG: hypothetical protein OXI24_12210 [Candidatus Poribacteria bacterium]|nr:hypothetical protein [Candidatus Poribacteria bacterium]
MANQKIRDISELQDGITFNLTRADIDEGIAVDCRKCPVARCLQRHFDENFFFFEVGLSCLKLVKMDAYRTYFHFDIGNRLKRWINNFDQFYLRHKNPVSNPITIVCWILENNGSKYRIFDIKKEGD